MKVCIAEKPSVAREIASVLGLPSNVRVLMKAMAMLYLYFWASLYSKEPNDYKPHWKSWDLTNLPMLPETF